MARPKKQTVDYFPHDANASSGKTLFILESKFNNDGYAFWFKLLELLANSEGHVYDCRNSSAWEFLLAKTHVSEDIANRILKTLSDLKAIDAELWQDKVLWVQNLVDRVADVYNNRRAPLPQKPSLNTQKSPAASISTTDNPCLAPVSTTENTQSKLKESKLKESKLLLGCSNSFSDNIFKTYEQEIGKLTPHITEEINSALQEFKPDEILDAIKKAVLANKRTWRYVAGILNNWRLEKESKLIADAKPYCDRAYLKLKKELQREPTPEEWESVRIKILKSLEEGKLDEVKELAGWGQKTKANERAPP